MGLAADTVYYKSKVRLRYFACGAVIIRDFPGTLGMDEIVLGILFVKSPAELRLRLVTSSGGG